MATEADITSKSRDQMLEVIQTEISNAHELMKKNRADYEDQSRVLKELRTDIEKSGFDAESRYKLEKTASDVADALAKTNACEQAIEMFKKELDSPFNRGGSDLKDSDRKQAIELQRRAHLHKGGTPDTFVLDNDNLVNMEDYRSAFLKMGAVGLETKAQVRSRMTPAEKKAFDVGSMGTEFFMPEVIGLEVDCNIECASLLDLYGSVDVTRSVFMYPEVESYEDMGGYECGATCDAPSGGPGDVAWKNGQTYDYKGSVCFNRDVLREANYPILPFTVLSMQRAYRLARNRALITGDGVNQPTGWLTASRFPTRLTANGYVTHQEVRLFLASIPVEYGRVVATMHQNMFAYISSLTDAEGRFIFGDGLMGMNPNDIRDAIRISNCLPDATEGLTKGNITTPFDAGAFIMAAGNWETAYQAVNHRPMTMEQHEGGSTKWCVSYQFGAKDGGFLACPNAARVLQAGAAA
jgi:hypothetical protein